MGHRRWLDGNHKFRFQRTLFDGIEEYRGAPEQTVGSEILFMLKDINFSYGKLNQPPNTQSKRRSRDESDDESDEEDDPNEADLWKKMILDVEELEKVQDRAALTLCNLEKIFPPSFFTIMVHLVWSRKDVNDEVKWLSEGLNRVIKRYSAFLINGYRFHTKYRERMRRTQNCGIVVNSSITSYASARDSNPVEGNVEYYGLLTDIIELDYYVKQVFYSKDPTDEGWYVVLRNTPRDLFDMDNGSRDDIVERSETLPFPEQNLDENIPSTTESGGTRRGLRRTLLKDLYELNPIERVKVSRNSHGQPVGSEARLLAGYLGIIARNANMLPINYESWHHMPDSNKNQALDNIKDRERVGISSRQKQKFTHTVGSRSFASVAEAEEKLKEKKAEYEAIASIDSSVNLENIDNRIITEVLGPERYGRVRFQGSGVTPTQYFGSGSQQYMPSGSQAQAEVQRLRDQIAQMQASTVEQIVEVQRKYEELQQQLRAEAAEREAAVAAREAEAAAMAVEQSRKYDKLQLQLQQMMQMF
ncbi:hypothetical protein PVK06_012669 [Gossypium arboreum]|uniref:DUF4218 domain-containing protein n=1 Tax=Gossypium arboreum TaxID=29729 RepID=A0ABR0QCG7_GOSAR|nr:hypothetical protein PVK06_012669 [Gossypium arboreum]